MEIEKLKKANELAVEIVDLEKYLDDIGRKTKAGKNNTDACYADCLGNRVSIDHDIFEIALFAQERRVQIRISEVQKELLSL